MIRIQDHSSDLYVFALYHIVLPGVLKKDNYLTAHLCLFLHVMF